MVSGTAGAPSSTAANPPVGLRERAPERTLGVRACVHRHGRALTIQLHMEETGVFENHASLSLVLPDFEPGLSMELERALRAIANDRRLRILDWLRDPERHFPPQVDGDLVEDGVCGLLIARKLQVTQPTASEHLKILQQARLIRGKRIKQWTFYKRDEVAIDKIKKLISSKI
jgi:DNA-binding transcriptional ArsR family regulator